MIFLLCFFLFSFSFVCFPIVQFMHLCKYCLLLFKGTLLHVKHDCIFKGIVHPVCILHVFLCNDQHGVNYVSFFSAIFSSPASDWTCFDIVSAVVFYGVLFIFIFPLLPRMSLQPAQDRILCELSLQQLYHLCLRRWDFLLLSVFFLFFFSKVNRRVIFFYSCLILWQCLMPSWPCFYTERSRLTWKRFICDRANQTWPPASSEKKRRNSSMYSTNVLFLCSS